LSIESTYLNSYLKLTSNQSLFKYYAQSLLLLCLYPKSFPDWYEKNNYNRDSSGKLVENSFENFIKVQTDWNEKLNSDKPKYYDAFKYLNFSIKKIKSKLAHKSFDDQNTSKDSYCELETMSCTPLLNNNGKHIVYFTGVNTCYQQFFKDITVLVKETSAAVHAFNYPGISGSTGVIREANDLINSGLAMVNYLSLQGIDPNDIILLGDCNGAAVAYDVKRILEHNLSINLKIIMNNAYSSMSGIIYDILTKIFKFIPGFMFHFIEFLVSNSGWDLSPLQKRAESGNNVFSDINEDRCYIQHIGDLTLKTSSIGDSVSNSSNYLYNIYKAQIKLKESEKVKHANKQNTTIDNIDSHLVPLCDCVLNDNPEKSIYSEFISPFIHASI